MGSAINGVPVGGGGGSTLPVSNPADLLAGATPSNIVATDASGNGTLLTPAQGRAALFPTITPSLSSSSGWTITNAGTATGAASGGAFTTTILAAGSGAVLDTSRAMRALPATSPFTVIFSVANGATGIGNTYGGVRVVFGGVVVLVLIDGNGSLGLDDGSYNLLATGQPIDGTLWVRVDFDGNRATAWRALGTTTVAPATPWLYCTVVTLNTSLGAPTSYGPFGANNAGNTLGSNATIAVRNLSVTQG